MGRVRNSLLLLLGVPLLGFGALGAAGASYWRGDMLRAIFWLIVGIAALRAAIALWTKARSE